MDELGRAMAFCDPIYGTNPRKSKGIAGTIARISPYLYSWSAQEVLYAAVASSSLEMDLVANWIVTAKFGNICDAIDKDVLHEPCVVVDGLLGIGSYFLLVSALLFGAVYMATSRYFGLGCLGTACE